MNTKATAALGLTCVFALGAVVHNSTSDLTIVQDANAFDTGALGMMTRGLYAAFEPPFAVLWALLASAGAWAYTKSMRSGLLFGMTVALTWLPVVLLKLIFHRPRPLADALAHAPALSPTDWSFSSGHVAFITTLALAFYLLTRRKWVAVLGVLAVGTMTVSVLIDGLHYPTDALGSIIWVLSLGPVVWAFLQKWAPAHS